MPRPVHRPYAVSEMRRTRGQSELQTGRRVPNALGGVVLLGAGVAAAAASAVLSLGSTAVVPALLTVLGAAALVSAGWLLGRLAGEAPDLAGERRHALDEILRAEEVERERIATELHDDTIQVITAALVTIDRMTPAVRAHDTERIAEVLPPTRAMLAEAAERVRRLTFELHPPLLEAHGLPVALADLIDRAARDAGLETDVVLEVGRYPFVVEDLAYRIVREAIADTRCHAGTSRLEVDIREHRGAVQGRVWDNGAGGRARRADDRPRMLLHLSLDRLAERVRLADGEMQVRSAPGQGTLVAFRLPLVDVPAPEVGLAVAAGAIV
jgi:two-component system, NarL family, sensor histidine kinase UhpB